MTQHMLRVDQDMMLLCSCFTSPIRRAARFAELAWGDRQAPMLELPTLKEAHLGWLQGMRQGEAHLSPPLCTAAVLCLASPQRQATMCKLLPLQRAQFGWLQGMREGRACRGCLQLWRICAVEQHCAWSPSNREHK